MNYDKENAFLPTVFLWYKLIGIWPPEFKSRLLKLLYDIYTIFVISILSSVVLMDLIGVYINSTSFDAALDEELFMIIMRINILLRIFVILRRRDRIAKLKEEYLVKRWSRIHLDLDMQELAEKYKNKNRTIMLAYCSVVSLCGTLVWIGKGQNNNYNYESMLPMNTWYPYDTRKPICFWFTLVHQALAMTVVSVVHITNVGLISGLMQHISMQLEILKREFTRISPTNGTFKISLPVHQRRMFKQCVIEHVEIIRFSKTVNELFGEIQFVFFFSATIIVCTTVYHLSKEEFGINFVMLLNYCINVLIQVYCYCWFGNEITLSGQDIINTVAELDSTLLTYESQQSRIIIMTYALKPIQFSSGGIVTWNIKSFLSILKTSYSIFNVLERTTL